MQDAAVLVVLDFVRGVDAHAGLELLGAAVLRGGGDGVKNRDGPRFLLIENVVCPEWH
jgi:hypothetical protein